MSVLVVGDSWASAVEGDTGLDRGWPSIMDIPIEYRQAIAGSTAEEWAANKDDRLSKAMETKTDTVIISLMGNDARAAYADGKVTSDEVSRALVAMRAVVKKVSRGRNAFVLLYADPFSGNDPSHKLILPVLNGAIRMASFGYAQPLDLGDVLGPKDFDGKDIHPTRAGHEVMAEYIGKIA